MRKTIAAAVAGAALCVLALAGCSGHSASSSPGPAAGTVTTSPAADDAQPGADGVPVGTPTGPAAVDSELNSVDQQLGAAGTDLAKATAVPSDGD